MFCSSDFLSGSFTFSAANLTSSSSSPVLHDGLTTAKESSGSEKCSDGSGGTKFGAVDAKGKDE